MISRSTVKILNLKPVTRKMCYDFYIEINSELETPDSIIESISWWKEDKEKLNRLWWVLNYYSEQLDPDRNLRAHVESHLDALAVKAKPEPEPEDDPESEAPPA
ncbi:hypothetical protein [Desulfospira joergensenii]|uniref:hypothetical protein n=1 Tax=Desulfospira joergensenii TaxID=53329 RepID=UPI000488AE0D|nr:hypothetical protein [Desulfospira joergensenii]